MCDTFQGHNLDTSSSSSSSSTVRLCWSYCLRAPECFRPNDSAVESNGIILDHNRRLRLLPRAALLLFLFLLLLLLLLLPATHGRS